MISIERTAVSHDINIKTAEISFLGVKIGLSMPKEIYSLFLDKYRSVLPEISDVVSGRSPDFFINYSFGEPSLKIVDNTAYMASKAKNSQAAIDVMLAASKFLERELNRNGIYSLHASAVALGKDGTIFLGHQGAGKTTVALSCSFLDPEVKLVSGSRVFVKEDKIVGGIPSIDLRFGSAVSELSAELRDRGNPTFIQHQQAWGQRILLRPEDLRVNLNTEYPIGIRRFVLVEKLPKELLVIRDSIDRDSFLVRVYDALYAFSEHIPQYILGSKIPYPDIFGDDMRQARIQFGERLLGSKQFIYLEGGLTEISTYVLRELLRT